MSEEQKESAEKSTENPAEAPAPGNAQPTLVMDIPARAFGLWAFVNDTVSRPSSLRWVWLRPRKGQIMALDGRLLGLYGGLERREWDDVAIPWWMARAIAEAGAANRDTRPARCAMTLPIATVVVTPASITIELPCAKVQWPRTHFEHLDSLDTVLATATSRTLDDDLATLQAGLEIDAPALNPDLWAQMRNNIGVCLGEEACECAVLSFTVPSKPANLIRIRVSHHSENWLSHHSENWCFLIAPLRRTGD